MNRNAKHHSTTELIRRFRRLTQIIGNLDFGTSAKIYGRFLCLFLIFATAASAAESGPIQEMTLDDHRLYTIPVSFSRVTTVSFPGPISAMDGALVTTDGKTAGLFQLAHTPGTRFFSVRSLIKSASTNLNVRWDNKTYVLELQDSSTPVLSLTFKIPASPQDPSPASRPVTPGMLLGMLDKAKAYPVLKANYPDAVAGVEYAGYTDKPRVMDYDRYEIRLEEVFRFDPQDTLVFHVGLRNKTDQTIRYEPQGFTVRVGDRMYSQSISDASGVMPPKSDSPAYFAITGTPSGGRNELSIKNDFTVILAPTDAAVEKAAQAVPLDNEKGFAK